MKTTTTKQFNDLLNLCIQAHKVKGVIQKSILDILSTSEKQSDFITFANTQILDKVFTDKIAKFQNNLNQKTTQELHFDIGEGESLVENIRLKRDPKSTLPQSERPYIFVMVEIVEPKKKTLEQEIEAFKKKMAKEFDTVLTITKK